MMNPDRTPLGPRIRDAAEEALDAGTAALETSKQFASDAAGRIGETARRLGDGAGDLARTGAESVSAATVAAQRQLGQLANATRQRMAGEPMKSALIAAAIGAAATALVLSIVRGRRDTD